jgi:hypothetical protein
MTHIKKIRERDSVDLGADIIERLMADDAYGIDAVLQLVVRSSAVGVLQQLASPNHAAQATGSDARAMAEYARIELERLGLSDVPT